jgi:hypothetical protein
VEGQVRIERNQVPQKGGPEKTGPGDHARTPPDARRGRGNDGQQSSQCRPHQESLSPGVGAVIGAVQIGEGRREEPHPAG